MSKTIYLFRHSEPADDRTIPTEQIPLSYEGRKKIAGMVPRFDRISDVYSSPYLRAVQTAEAFGMKVSVDDRLHERTIGRPEAFTKDLWELQYHDRALKLAGGESNAQDRCFRLFGHLHLFCAFYCSAYFLLCFSYARLSITISTASFTSSSMRSNSLFSIIVFFTIQLPALLLLHPVIRQPAQCRTFQAVRESDS